MYPRKTTPTTRFSKLWDEYSFAFTVGLIALVMILFAVATYAQGPGLTPLKATRYRL